MAEITLIVAFLAGLASFLSPCILPLIPVFFSYISGTTFQTAQVEPNARRSVVINTIFFVLGFTVIFAFIGILLNSLLQAASYSVKIWLSRIGGAVIILFGLYLLGLIKANFLQREYKLHVGKFKNAYLSSFVFGAAFAIGWSPCVGAVLGTVLTLAITEPGAAFGLLLSYALGLGIPFLIFGIFISRSVGWIQKISHSSWFKYFNYVMGILLIILGILVFTDQLSRFAYLIIADRLMG